MTYQTNTSPKDLNQYDLQIQVMNLQNHINKTEEIQFKRQYLGLNDE